MIVDCAVYEHGVRLPGERSFVEAYETGCHQPDRFVWIGLYEPTQAEFDEVTGAFHLPPLAVEDAIVAHERPKIDEYDDCVFVVFKTAWLDEEHETVELGQMVVFVGHDFVVTVRHGQSAEMRKTRARLEGDPSTLVWGPTSVLYAITDRIVDLYDGLADQLDIVIDDVEKQVFGGPRAGQAGRIFQIRREILDLRRAVVPLLDPVERMASGKVMGIDPSSTSYFRDIHDHLLRASDQIDKSDKLLESALDALVAQVGLQQNEDMRKISAWVAILAVPTAIAGIYGMNFDHMPELRQEYGYFMVLGFMALCCTALYFNFKKRGWLGKTERVAPRAVPKTRRRIRHLHNPFSGPMEET